jgi:hypothetical protein
MSFRRRNFYTRRKSNSPSKNEQQPILLPLFPTTPSTSSAPIVCQPRMGKLRRRPDRSKTGSAFVHAAAPLLTLPGRRTYTQPSRLHPDKQNRQSRPDGCAGDALTDSLHVNLEPESTEARQTKRTRKRQKQWAQWSDEVIPSLIQPYLRYLRKSNSLRKPIPPQLTACTQGCQSRSLEVTCVLFDGKIILLLVGRGSWIGAGEGAIDDYESFTTDASTSFF